jgi:dihydroorotase
MSKSYLIKHGRIVTDGKIEEKDLLIENERIVKIEEGQGPKNGSVKVIDASGYFVLPGVIDDQVHFREPGLTHKGTIETESMAAIAGGITSFIEQPNTVPQATTLELLEEKYAIAAKSAYANYGFNLGATNANLEELKRADKSKIPGVKIFMGSSTGNMLVDNEKALEGIFSELDIQLFVHCEDETTIKKNLDLFQQQYGDNIPMSAHHLIRSEEACYLSSKYAVDLARKHNTKLHVYHISTAKELDLFESKPLTEKRITAEACIHHLWFDDTQYDALGAKIKWNPAVKTAADRDAIWAALLDGRIDVVATDHAPHTLQEKAQQYTKSPSGGPLVQHALVAMVERVKDGLLTMEQLVEKMCHNPATLLGLSDRGFLREGYMADVVLLEASRPWVVQPTNILYHCGWSPFEGNTFRSKVQYTFVNGQLAYENGRFVNGPHGRRLTYDRG